ncbi:MAG: hypothetical protein WD314_00915, partial [Trueperaceae bacterium]
MLSLAAILATAVAPAGAQWRTSTSTDQMTGEQTAYAISTRVSPTERMAFPYGDTEGWVGFGCDGDSEWAYLGFSDEPNLINGSTQDGYSRIINRVRWDDHVENMTFTQEWGAAFLHFASYADAIAKLESAGTMLVELRWYGAGDVYFQFSLSGSSAAIERARAECSSGLIEDADRGFGRLECARSGVWCWRAFSQHAVDR